ncbi:MAG: alpha-E domain-containing protein [Rhodospirillales bacterium]|nr:alpha-E domain-containing protein [Rhodospirillales bacterium]
MLGRTAGNLYWMARYLERAENTARLLGGTYRMSLLPRDDVGTSHSWESLFITDAEKQKFLDTHKTFAPAAVITYLALDLENPISIAASIRAARENVRATRHVLTAELWESINQTWLEIRAMTYADIKDMGQYEFFEWIKERSHLFRGIVHGTMRRGEAYDFWRLGSFIERAENTAQLMLAKVDSFQGPASRQENAVDFYQWGTLLRSVNAYKTYREIYRGAPEPRKVAELMILKPDMPRSLRSCIDEIFEILNRVRRNTESAQLADVQRAMLITGQVDKIFRSGLDRYLTNFRTSANHLSSQIQIDFMMVR